MAFNNQPTATLNNGNKIPVLGFGFWKSEGGQAGTALQAALEVGYRHLDSAAIYANEKEIGAVLGPLLRDGKYRRDELFITSKLWNTCHEPSRVRDACLRTLRDLQIDYLDLYLIHWPIAFEWTGEELEDPLDFVDDQMLIKTIPVPMRDTWREMEKLVEAGLVRNIGVSNVSPQLLNDILSYATIKPAINQVELNPYLTQRRLRQACQRAGVNITGFSPLGNGAADLLNNPVLTEIATKYNKTVPNIIVRWEIQLGVSVLIKSVTRSRIESNFAVFDFELTPEEVEKISALNKDHRTCDSAEFWSIPVFDN